MIRGNLASTAASVPGQQPQRECTKCSGRCGASCLDTATRWAQLRGCQIDTPSVQICTHLHAPVPLEGPHHLPAPARQPEVDLRDAGRSCHMKAHGTQGKQMLAGAELVSGHDSSCG
jgi:hypothetical protein